MASWRGLAACVPLVAFALVGARWEHHRRPRWLLAAGGVAALALVLGWQVAVRRAERAYVEERLAGADAGARRRLERLHPSATAWQLAAGHTFSSLGRNGLAIEAYSAAARGEPTLVSARNGLGLSLLRAGRGSEAAAELRAATRILPASAPLRHNSGWRCSLPAARRRRAGPSRRRSRWAPATAGRGSPSPRWRPPKGGPRRPSGTCAPR